jgi:hypothetical protein
MSHCRISRQHFWSVFPTIHEKTLRENIITLLHKESDEYMIIFREDELLYYCLPECGRFETITSKHLTSEIMKTVEDLGPPNMNGLIYCVYAEIGTDKHVHRIYITENERSLIQLRIKDEYEKMMYYDRITS